MKTPLARSNSAAGQHKYKKGKRIILHIPKLSYLASLSQSVLKIGTSCFPNVIAKWCGEFSTSGPNAALLLPAEDVLPRFSIHFHALTSHLLPLLSSVSPPSSFMDKFKLSSLIALKGTELGEGDTLKTLGGYVLLSCTCKVISYTPRSGSLFYLFVEPMALFWISLEWVISPQDPQQSGKSRYSHLQFTTSAISLTSVPKLMSHLHALHKIPTWKQAFSSFCSSLLFWSLWRRLQQEQLAVWNRFVLTWQTAIRIRQGTHQVLSWQSPDWNCTVLLRDRNYHIHHSWPPTGICWQRGKYLCCTPSTWAVKIKYSPSAEYESSNISYLLHSSNPIYFRNNLRENECLTCSPKEFFCCEDTVDFYSSR